MFSQCTYLDSLLEELNFGNETKKNQFLNSKNMLENNKKLTKIQLIIIENTFHQEIEDINIKRRR